MEIKQLFPPPNPPRIPNYDEPPTSLSERKKFPSTQILTVNVRLWYNIKLLKMNYFKFLLNQLVIIITLLFVALLTKQLVHYLVIVGIINLITNFILYAILTISIIWLFPQLLLKSRKEIEVMFGKYFALIKGKFKL